MGIFDLFRKAKRPREPRRQRSDSPGGRGAQVCFVLCPEAGPGDLSRAARVIARHFGRGYTAEVSENDIVSVTRGEETVGFLAHMPVPVPNGEAEDNADRNFLWPDGRQGAAAHRSHVIVTNMGGKDESPVQQALTLSRLALAALELFDGIGVYWGTACVSNSREIFEQFCDGMSAEHLPIPVWLRFQVVRAGDDGVGLYTLGMEQFGLMNIEVVRCTMELGKLLDFVSNIAHYLIQSGPVIADGNTVGGSAEERILVRHRPSMIDEQRTVYQIVFE